MSSPLTDDELRDGLHAIARWGTPAATPPLPEPRPAELVPLHRQRRPQRAAWWGAAAAVVAALLGLAVAGAVEKPGPAPIADGRWSTMAPAPVPARSLAASVWTGGEVVIVGGQDPGGALRRDAAAYSPKTNTWRSLPDAPVDIPPGAHALWTGSEVVVVSGTVVRLTTVPDGFISTQLPPPVALNPATGVWRALPPPPHPLDAAVFVDGRIVAMATHDKGTPVVYDLAPTGEWREIAVPSAADTDMYAVREWRAFPIDGRAVFIASEWISFYLQADSPVGFAVDVEAGLVEPIMQPPVPSTEAGNLSSMVNSKIAPLGNDSLLVLQRSSTERGEVVELPARYSLRTKAWRGVPPLRDYPITDEFFVGMSLTAVGDDAVLFGGIKGGMLDGRDEGGLHRGYDAHADRWRTINKPGIPADRVGHVAVWTGEELVVWGGVTRQAGPVNRADTRVDSGAVYRFGK